MSVLVALGAGIIGMVGILIYNASGPTSETSGTVVSTRYSEGWSTTTNIDLGNGVSIPQTTHYPGYWIVLVDSPVFGRTEVDWSENLAPGRQVYLEYVVGGWSHEPELVEMHLTPNRIKMR